jgi:hypothetical protein
LLRQLAPMRALPRRDRRQARQARDDRLAPRIRRMLSTKRHVARIVDRPDASRRAIEVGQRIRLHRHPGVDRRLEQVGVEGQQLALGGGGAFREEGDALVLGQRVDQALEDVAQLAPVAARDEHGAGLRPPASRAPARRGSRPWPRSGRGAAN